MSSSTYIAVILLAFLSGITVLIGVALAFLLKKSQKAVVLGLGISAGIMLLISFFELIPEAARVAGLLKVFLAVILGIIVVLVLDFIFPHLHITEEKKGRATYLSKAAFLVAFGLILHDFPEGFAMANSYVLTPALGIFVAIGIAIHNIPEEFAIAIPLILTDKKSLLWKIALLSALAEPAGAILGLFAADIFPALNPLLLGFAAGAMVFVSIHELLPLALKYRNIPLFILGLAISALVYMGLSVLIPV